MFVREYGYTLSEYATDRPWVVLSSEHRTVVLADDANVLQWAAEHWPRPRWSVQLDPWSLTPAWPR